MSGRNRPEGVRPTGGLAVVDLCLGVLFGLTVVGCAEHRVNLDEFLQMQQEARQAALTTQPAVDQQAAAALLDEHLGPYKVGPSDVLLVSLISEIPTVAVSGAEGGGLIAPVQVRVDRNGEIELPVVGLVKVAGMELEDVEDTIQKAYVPHVFEDAVVYVELALVDTTNVLVRGAVTNPGIVPLRRTERNMLFAIVGAGGVSEAASGRATLRRLRRPEVEVTFDLTDPLQLKDALALDPLEDGDIVTVEAATPNLIFVGGLVNAPRPQAYPPGVEMTVLQAIAASGGLRTDVTPREATLIRRMPDGQDVHVKLDLDRLAMGKDPNITLAAGDILWVPETLETRVQDWINRNFFIRTGVSATVSYNVSGIEFLNRHNLQAGGVRGTGLEQAFDPLGFLQRTSLLQAIPTIPPPATPP